MAAARGIRGSPSVSEMHVFFQYIGRRNHVEKCSLRRHHHVLPVAPGDRGFNRRVRCPRTAPPKFVHAIAMKTRSATKAQRVEEEEEAVEPLPLDKLAPEVLNIIAEALAADEDILIPRHLGSLARSCKVIKEAVKDAKDKLKVDKAAAEALCLKNGIPVWRLLEMRPTKLGSNGYYQSGYGLQARAPQKKVGEEEEADAPALTNVLKSEAMARVETLNLAYNSLGEGRHCHRGCGCGRRYAAAQVAGAPQE